LGGVGSGSFFGGGFSLERDQACLPKRGGGVSTCAKPLGKHAKVPEKQKKKKCAADEKEMGVSERKGGYRKQEDVPFRPEKRREAGGRIPNSKGWWLRT